ncbi:hypothetical protein E2C01_050378 [Portunus trituberculatus]|uniref:Uncharacterized protein n=1 Tax=Portunus trituberculatus TaxID=210409 RepID=A0A5B7GGL6_PORTR|nr:hypothetical protein [Portunus trituberculatus]
MYSAQEEMFRYSTVAPSQSIPFTCADAATKLRRNILSIRCLAFFTLISTGVVRYSVRVLRQHCLKPARHQLMLGLVRRAAE